MFATSCLWLLHLVFWCLAVWGVCSCWWVLFGGYWWFFYFVWLVVWLFFVVWRSFGFCGCLFVSLCVGLVCCALIGVDLVVVFVGWFGLVVWCVVVLVLVVVGVIGWGCRVWWFWFKSTFVLAVLVWLY